MGSEMCIRDSSDTTAASQDAGDSGGADAESDGKEDDGDEVSS